MFVVPIIPADCKFPSLQMALTAAEPYIQHAPSTADGRECYMAELLLR